MKLRQESLRKISTKNLTTSTILFNGETIRSCLTLAVQANGATLLTVEGLAPLVGGGQELHPIQKGFLEEYGLQCGFCTPGFLMTIYEFLNENPSPSEGEIRERLSGNLCRCTGYQNIVAAVKWATGHFSEATPEKIKPYRNQILPTNQIKQKGKLKEPL